MLHNFRSSPTDSAPLKQIDEAIEIVGSIYFRPAIMSLRTIDWENVLNDPIFTLTFLSYAANIITKIKQIVKRVLQKVK
jgi:hypothetical protein